MLSLSISVVLGLVAFFAAVSATATADFTNHIRAIPDDPVAPERYGDFLDHVKSARSYRGPARLDVDTMKRSPRRPRAVPRNVNQKKLMKRAPVVVESTNDPKKRQFLGKLVNLKMGGAAGGQKPLGGERRACRRLPHGRSPMWNYGDRLLVIPRCDWNGGMRARTMYPHLPSRTDRPWKRLRAPAVCLLRRRWSEEREREKDYRWC